MALKLCTAPNCSRPVRARELCLTHYSKRWKVGDLPPMERKDLFVCQKLYLTKEQSFRVRQLAGKSDKRMSEFLREVIENFLQQCEAEES